MWLVARAIAACTTAGEETANARVWCSPIPNTSRPDCSARMPTDDVIDPARRRVGAAGVDVGEGEDNEFHESPNLSQAAEARTPRGRGDDLVIETISRSR
jgi:hypothetical protein